MNPGAVSEAAGGAELGDPGDGAAAAGGQPQGGHVQEVRRRDKLIFKPQNPICQKREEYKELNQ